MDSFTDFALSNLVGFLPSQDYSVLKVPHIVLYSTGLLVLPFLFSASSSVH
jgi:hypothetical protein